MELLFLFICCHSVLQRLREREIKVIIKRLRCPLAAKIRQQRGADERAEKSGNC